VIFTSTQFDPEAFDTTAAMLASIYPYVTASPACLAVIGVSTTIGTSPNSSANVDFGPSNDRSMTARLWATKFAVAGWDPRSSSQTFPAATGMFVEKLSEARIELINQAG